MCNTILSVFGPSDLLQRTVDFQMRNLRFGTVCGLSHKTRKAPFFTGVNFGEEAPKPGPVPCVIGCVWSSEGLAGGSTVAEIRYPTPLARHSHLRPPQPHPRNGGRISARPRPRRRGQLPGRSDRSPNQVLSGQPSPRARAETVSPRRRRSARRASSA